MLERPGFEKCRFNFLVILDGLVNHTGKYREKRRHQVRRHPDRIQMDGVASQTTHWSRTPLLKKLCNLHFWNKMQNIVSEKIWKKLQNFELGKGKTVLFAFEEAIGFMLGQNVLDKDGVSAAAVMAEIIAFLSESKTSLAQQLGSRFSKSNFCWKRLFFIFSLIWCAKNK